MTPKVNAGLAARYPGAAAMQHLQAPRFGLPLPLRFRHRSTMTDAAKLTFLVVDDNPAMHVAIADRSCVALATL